MFSNLKEIFEWENKVQNTNAVKVGFPFAAVLLENHRLSSIIDINKRFCNMYPICDMECLFWVSGGRCFIIIKTKILFFWLEGGSRFAHTPFRKSGLSPKLFLFTNINLKIHVCLFFEKSSSIFLL